MDFSEQLARIMQKLELARSKDPELKVFGADNHEYAFDAPLSRKEVTEFEKEYEVRLPDDYVAFITTIGNGGPGHYGGAGPFYGIYPLGDFGYMPTNAEGMNEACVITSSLTEDQWEELTEFDRKVDKDGYPADSLHNAKYDALFYGMMSIGTAGCNGQTMLILNGKDKGRVAYIDQDLSMPGVQKEKNFLDWYEAWLDRIADSSDS